MEIKIRNALSIDLFDHESRKKAAIEGDYTGGIERKIDSMFPIKRNIIMNHNRNQASSFLLLYKRWGFSDSFLCSQIHR